MHRKAKLTLLTTLIASVIAIGLLPIQGHAQTASSPTGRSPKVLWTPERQAVLNALKDDPKWGSYIKQNADAAITIKSYNPDPIEARRETLRNCYGCYGSWQTLYYQMTGDVSYAQEAWSRIEPIVGTFPPPLPEDGSNGTRQGLMLWPWMYDWLYPALTDTQRDQFRKAMYYYADLTRGNIPGKHWGTRLDDSDEVVGHYFGSVLIGLATQAHDPRANEFINDPKIGGLDSTGANVNTTWRNAVEKFIQMAAGGEWIESSDYNLNTMQLFIWGVEGTKTAAGKNHFPSTDSLYKDFAKAYTHQLTPDLKDWYEWGDIQNPHDLWFYGRTPLMQILTFANRDDTALASQVAGMVKDLNDTNSANRYIKQPSIGFFLFYTPDITPDTQWRSKLGNSHNVAGQGISYSKSGWDALDSFFSAMFQTGETFVDHQMGIFGDFELYRKGEWAIGHPYGYTPDLRSLNAMRFNNIATASQEIRTPIAREVGTNDEYTYYVGSTGGSIVYTPYYNPPDTFFHEWTRSLFYLPSKDKSSDTVVIFDRTNIENPKELYGWTNSNQPCAEGGRRGSYYCDKWNGINEAKHRKEWIIHMPKVPTIGNNKVSWKTEKGQSVEVITHLPEAHDTAIYNEIDPNTVPDCKTRDGASVACLYDSRFSSLKLAGNWNGGQRKFQVQISPKTDQQWDTFLHVVTASDTASTVQSEAIKSANGEAEGTLIKRAGHNNTAILFSATQGQKLLAKKAPDGRLAYDRTQLETLKNGRLFKTGYAVSLSATADKTDLFLADLDPRKQWGLTDNGQTVTLNVSDQSLGKAQLSGTGQHQLVLSARDTAHVNLTKTVDKGTATVGDTITITINYKNIGSKNASSVKIVDSIAQGTEYYENSATSNGSKLDNTVVWRLPALKPGDSGSVSYTIKVVQ